MIEDKCEQQNPSFFEPIKLNYMTAYFADGKSILVGFKNREDCVIFEKHIERLLAYAKNNPQ